MELRWGLPSGRRRQCPRPTGSMTESSLTVFYPPSTFRGFSLVRSRTNRRMCIEHAAPRPIGRLPHSTHSTGNRVPQGTAEYAPRSVTATRYANLPLFRIAPLSAAPLLRGGAIAPFPSSTPMVMMIEQSLALAASPKSASTYPDTAAAESTQSHRARTISALPGEPFGSGRSLGRRTCSRAAPSSASIASATAALAAAGAVAPPAGALERTT